MFVVIRFLKFPTAHWWHTGFLRPSKVCVTRRVVFNFSSNEIMRGCESYNTVISFVFSALSYFLFNFFKITYTKILCLLAFVLLGLITKYTFVWRKKSAAWAGTGCTFRFQWSFIGFICWNILHHSLELVFRFLMFLPQNI